MRILGRAAHGIAHVIGGTGSKRCHVVRSHIGVWMDDADRFGRHSKNFSSDLGHGGVGTLTHIYRAATNSTATVTVNVHHRYRSRRRDARFDSNRNTAAAANRSGAAIEWVIPLHSFRQAV